MSTACFIFKIPREHIGPSFSQMSTPTEWASGVELAWIRRGELTKARWRHGPGAQRWGQRWVWTGSKVIHPKWWKGNVGTKLFTYLVLLLFGFVPGVGFPGGSSGKGSACQCMRCKRFRFDPWVGKISWRRTWQPTAVFLTGKSCGQRSLVGHNAWKRKESDMTEAA